MHTFARNPQDVRVAACRRLFRPILEYGSCVWNPQGEVFQQEVKKVQNRAARFVTIPITVLELGSMTGILEKLKWNEERQ